MSSRPARVLNIVDRSLPKGKNEVSLSAFAFLFSELVQYSQQNVTHIGELEKKLEEAGHGIGVRLLEVLCFRDRQCRREIRLLDLLKFIHTNVWRCCFNKPADSLEQGNDADDEFMISDKDLLVNKFISVPKDYGQLNCGAFVAGIVKGVLDSAGFPSRVSAHFVPVAGSERPKTTILMKFDAATMKREARMG
uniref:Trafficking protein particle complex subunit n=1 Tax=Tetraselmis chuii TaxID=63592 RepID=A0A7S1SV93_9CHLO|mmetsp:Transcript_2997/g.5410  ORF Transcript_2997/g.5410 Transcript_2997/m.5410 type:complete len:193 (+) Transcript_2997:147-725(+)